MCGVASASLGYRTSATLDAMKSVVGRLVEGRQFASFRVSARRAFKTYPMSSVEMNRALGAFVLERVPTTRVNLERFEVEIVVEVLPDEAFVSLDRRPGPGGLPVGASGTVAALLSGGIDSPVAAWRMMKRGCRVVFVHFHSVPYLPRDLAGQGPRAGRALDGAGSTPPGSTWCRSARSSARSCSRCRRPRGSWSIGA